MSHCSRARLLRCVVPMRNRGAFVYAVMGAAIVVVSCGGVAVEDRHRDPASNDGSGARAGADGGAIVVVPPPGAGGSSSVGSSTAIINPPAAGGWTSSGGFGSSGRTDVQPPGNGGAGIEVLGTGV